MPALQDCINSSNGIRNEKRGNYRMEATELLNAAIFKSDF